MGTNSSTRHRFRNSTIRSHFEVDFEILARYVVQKWLEIQCLFIMFDRVHGSSASMFNQINFAATSKRGVWQV